MTNRGSSTSRGSSQGRDVVGTGGLTSDSSISVNYLHDASGNYHGASSHYHNHTGYYHDATIARRYYRCDATDHDTTDATDHTRSTTGASYHGSDNRWSHGAGSGRTRTVGVTISSARHLITFCSRLAVELESPSLIMSCTNGVWCPVLTACGVRCICLLSQT